MARKQHGIEIPEGVDGPDLWTPDGDFDAVQAAIILEETKDWPPAQRTALLGRLRAAEAAATMRLRYHHPAHLAQTLDPSYVITPALDLISTSVEKVLNSALPLNAAISVSPQEGKSSLAAMWTPIRALQLHPTWSIVLATYASDLAQDHSRKIRSLIEQYGGGVTDPMTGIIQPDQLGMRLKRGANRVDAWQIEGTEGGLYAVGRDSSITGKRADLLIIDDPYKNSKEADSTAVRRQVDDWFATVARTRLSPSASIILVQTRWHPEDLIGQVKTADALLPSHERFWRFINIPAISEEGIPDALNRPPGVPMISARDTPEAKRDFVKTRREVGERAFYNMYQGAPTNPAGGIFQRAWFDPRLTGPPPYPVAAVVGVDPADSGEGDDAGIIGGMLSSGGTIALTHDRSGKYTSDQWAYHAVILALEIGARVLGVESYQSSETYVQVVRRAYAAIHREALDKRAAGAPLTPIETRAVAEYPPFTIRKWRGANKADAIARAAGLSQSLEVKRCRTVEHALAVFEEQAADWQVGQHQPDRVASAIIVHDILMELSGGGMHIAGPPTTPKGPGGNAAAVQIPAYLRRKIPG